MSQILTTFPDIEVAMPDLGPLPGILRRYGCAILRGDDAMKAEVSAYRDHLQSLHYFDRGRRPGEGHLYAHQRSDTDFKFPLHDLIQRRLIDFLETYFDASLFMSTVGTVGVIRTVDAATGQGGVHLHQDGTVVGFEDFLSCWFLLDPADAGKTAPGVIYVLSKGERRKELLAHGQYGKIENLQLTRDEFYWAPEVQLGDVILFDRFVPHTSHWVAGMERNRTSADIRVTPFEPRSAHTLLKPDKGLLIFDRKGMVAPKRLDGDFEYGVSGISRFVVDAFATAIAVGS